MSVDRRKTRNNEEIAVGTRSFRSAWWSSPAQRDSQVEAPRSSHVAGRGSYRPVFGFLYGNAMDITSGEHRQMVGLLERKEIVYTWTSIPDLGASNRQHDLTGTRLRKPQPATK